jgi:hypothetical protein
MSSEPEVRKMPKFTEARYEENFPGAALTPDEVEFARAMERYMRLQRRPFPTWHEVLAVIHALGYRRVKPDKPDVTPPDEVRHSE